MNYEVVYIYIYKYTIVAEVFSLVNETKSTIFSHPDFFFISACWLMGGA